MTSTYEKGRRQRVNAKIASAQKEKDAREAAQKLLKKARLAEKRVPHLKEVVEELLAAHGGIKGLVAKSVNEYEMAKPGSLQRTRNLEILMRLLQIATSTGIAQNQSDFSMLQEADIEAMAAGLLAKVQSKTQGSDGPDPGQDEPPQA